MNKKYYVKYAITLLVFDQTTECFYIHVFTGYVFKFIEHYLYVCFSILGNKAESV